MTTKQCGNCANWDSKETVEYSFKHIEKSKVSECVSKDDRADPMDNGERFPVFEERKE